MLVTITCEKCRKRYQVDSKLGGRKVKCKACGNAMLVPVPENPVSGDDLMAGLQAAAQAEQPRAATPAPVQTEPVFEVEGATPPPPPPPPALLASEPDLGLAPPPMPLPPMPELPPAEPEPPRRPRPLVTYQEEERDYRGVRLNRDHASTVLIMLDRLTVIVGQLVFWIVVALILLVVALLMWALHLSNDYRRDHNYPLVPGVIFLICIFIPPVTIAFYLAALKPFCSYAAGLAGRIMLFDLPEEPLWRLVSTDVMANVFFFVGWIIMALLAVIGGGLLSVNMGGITALLLLFTAPLAIPLHFLLTWLTLRLKFLEALLAWLFMGIAAVLAGGTYLTLVVLLIIWAAPTS